MTIISIDIENSAGDHLGSGPIRTATSLTVRSRLDQAGTIDFEMPVTDPRAALIVPNTLRYARAHTQRGQTRIQACYGLIKERGKGSEDDTAHMSGPDLAGELSHRHVGKLLIGTDLGDEEYEPLPAADVFDLIEPFIPGWAITGTPSQSVYYKSGDESVLGLLKKLTELTGDHWRLDPDVERQVEWLPTTSSGFVPTASGLRAIDQGDPARLESNDDVCLIVGGLQEVADAHERVTRVLLRGGGNGDAQLYINATTRHGANGITGDYDDGDVRIHIDATNPDLSYIKSISAEAGGDLVEGVVTLRDIAPISDSATDAESAANALVDAGKIELRRRLQEQRSYRLRVTKVRKPLIVGDSIHVVCRHYVDGYGWMTVDEHLLILEVATTYDAEGGEPEHTLTVTQIEADRWPVNETKKLVDTVKALRDTASHVQPAQRALTAQSAGSVSDPDLAYLNVAQTFTDEQTITTALTDPATVNDGMTISSTTTTTVDSLQVVRGLQVTVRGAPANTKTMSTANTVRAMIASAGNSGQGSIAQAVCFYAQIANTGSGNITDVYCFRALNPNTSGGTITNAYGVHIAAQAGGTVTNPYGVYQAGTSDQNYFAGRTTFAASITLPWAQKNTNYTLTTADYGVSVDASGGSRTITLPMAASAGAGRVYVIKRNSSGVNTVTIDGNGTETIDGALTVVLTTQYQSVTVVCNGTGWEVI